MSAPEVERLSLLLRRGLQQECDGGAANILQEILTIKSDDVMGRAKAYEAIVKGDNLPKPGIPEAMNVLLHELRGLALSVKLE